MLTVKLTEFGDRQNLNARVILNAVHKYLKSQNISCRDNSLYQSTPMPNQTKI
jgi:hypothetical protein